MMITKLVSSVLIVGLIVVAMTGLRKDPNDLQAELLKEKPLGTSIEEVTRWLKEDKKLKPEVANTGFLKQPRQGARSVVGVKSIEVELGTYWSFPFSKMSVVAFFGFDEAGKLIEVWIWKTADAP